MGLCVLPRNRGSLVGQGLRLSLRVVQRSRLLDGMTLSRCPISVQNVLSDLRVFLKVVLNQRGLIPQRGTGTCLIISTGRAFLPCNPWKPRILLTALCAPDSAPQSDLTQCVSKAIGEECSHKARGSGRYLGPGRWLDGHLLPSLTA